MDYDKTEIASSYVKGRKLPEGMLALWMDAVYQRVRDPGALILDVGCGIGRFSAALGERFGARVVGIEPSYKMLAQAPTSDPSVHYVRGSALAMPVRSESAGLIFLSMVYHHLGDVDTVFRDFYRVLEPGGSLCIRNSTARMAETAFHIQYFPSTMELLKQKLPEASDLITAVGRNGFTLVDHSVLDHLFAGSYEEYLEKIGHRALSDLASISDEEFEEGMRKMKEAADSQPAGPIYEPIDLFVFQRR